MNLIDFNALHLLSPIKEPKPTFTQKPQQP
jgi:hypothetical protein